MAGNTIFRFEEKQYFRKWWFVALIIIVNIIMICSIIYKLEVIKDNNDNHSGLYLSCIVTILVSIFITNIHLTTKVTDDGISVKMWPLHIKYRFYPWQNIEQCYIRQYKPILEYGGYGIRWSITHGKAYNISGKEGLQLILKNGNKVLIGTQETKELEAVIHIMHQKGIIKT